MDTTIEYNSFLTEATETATAIVSEMREAQASEAASLLAAASFATEAVERQTVLGKTLASVTEARNKFFGEGSKKQHATAWTAWYTSLGLDKQEVSAALTRARSQNVIGKKLATELSVSQLAKLAAVINETDENEKLLPKPERKRNTLAVIEEAQATATEAGRELQASDITDARKTLGIVPPQKREASKKQAKSKAAKAITALLALQLDEFATMPEEEWTTVLTWVSNVEQQRALLATIATEEATA